MPATWSSCPHCKVVFQSTSSPPTPCCPSCSRFRWYLAQGRQKLGPFDFGQLRERLRNHQLDPNDMLLRADAKKWVKADSIPGLVVAPSVRTDPHDSTLSVGAAQGGTLPYTRPPEEDADELPRIPGYTILGELGRGGMGVVYQAKHVPLDRIVALKMIRGPVGSSSDVRTRFRTEAEAVARAQHSNIVQIYEIGEYRGQPFFSLEYVEGGSLAQRLAGEPLSGDLAVRLLLPLTDAVQAAHDKGVVHRDLKPANILLGGNPEAPLTQSVAKVADFGLAKRLDNDSANTQTGAIMGTPSYMAPEQAGGDVHSIGPAADVYALGAILYEMLTGRPPFRSPSVLETLEQVRKSDPVAPRTLQPSVPRDLETICLKCLAKEPERRYSSARELHDDLERYSRKEPILARPASLFERSLKFTMRNKMLVGGTLAVILSLLVGFITTSIEAGRAQRAEAQIRRDTANFYAKEARFKLGKGDLKGALTLCDTAEEAKYPDKLELDLLRIRARLRLNQVREARVRLDKLLETYSDFGEHEGVVLMFRGYTQVGGDTEAGVRLLRQSLRKGLPKADREFVRGLMSRTSPEAVEAFQKAVDAEWGHYEARSMLCLTLLALGQLGDLRELAHESKGVFPNDPSFVLMLGVIDAIEGKFDRAKTRIQSTKNQMSAEYIVAFEGIVEAYEAMYRNIDESGHGKLLDPQVLGKLAPMMKVLNPDKKVNTVPDAILVGWLQASPLVMRRLDKVFQVAMKLVGGKRDEQLLKDVTEAIEIHPEGALYSLRGAILTSLGRLVEAEQAFEHAKDMSSFLIFTRRLSLLGEVGTGAQVLLSGLANDERKLLDRLHRNVRELHEKKWMDPTLFDLAVEIAARKRDFGLAVSLLDDWERVSKNELEVLMGRIYVADQMGASSLAVRSARSFLGIQSENVKAQQMLTKHLQLLRQMAGPVR